MWPANDFELGFIYLKLKEKRKLLTLKLFQAFMNFFLTLFQLCVLERIEVFEQNACRHLKGQWKLQHHFPPQKKSIYEFTFEYLGIFEPWMPLRS